jgi:hypothetical protein
MRLPRVRMTLRGMMAWVAILAVLLVTARWVLGYLGPRDGFYTGSYRYLGSDWKWHEVRGASIYVKGPYTFVD